MPSPESVQSSPTRGKSDGVWVRMRRNLMAGALVLGPVMVTAWLLGQAFQVLDGILADSINHLLRDGLGLRLLDGKPIPGLGLLALLALLLLTGYLARQVVGQWLIARAQALLNRIPLVSRVYQAVEQISKAIFSGKQDVFKQAVLLEYPRPGIYSIGIVTADTSGRLQEALPEDCVSVFLVTSPNPTTGFLLFVPKREIIPLDMSVEDALKQIISAGAIGALTEKPSRKG